MSNHSLHSFRFVLNHNLPTRHQGIKTIKQQSKKARKQESIKASKPALRVLFLHLESQLAQLAQLQVRLEPQPVSAASTPPLKHQASSIKGSASSIVASAQDFEAQPFGSERCKVEWAMGAMMCRGRLKSHTNE
jgi:hypothetical protein